MDAPILFTHKLFDAKAFGSPTATKTPRSKAKDEFKSPAPPSTTKKIAERKTPFGKLIKSVNSTFTLMSAPCIMSTFFLCYFAGNSQTSLGECLKSFKHYTFLKSLDGLYQELKKKNSFSSSLSSKKML